MRRNDFQIGRSHQMLQNCKYAAGKSLFLHVARHKDVQKGRPSRQPTRLLTKDKIVIPVSNRITKFLNSVVFKLNC